ncbi:hypothetical protein [Legionella parisiensis]|uniref:hypothetical protein n=1 Tax=Legionella parisiensis TaxID=45071 RepID=UPI000730F0D2|nr:hypothetical protein [Legionella parisiensis]KTD41858.1 hypothetical protein Lpar_3175 [Legionella parisiensis]STX75815.1 Uncharacterised protein [Legionella parisiensis]
MDLKELKGKLRKYFVKSSLSNDDVIFSTSIKTYKDGYLLFVHKQKRKHHFFSDSVNSAQKYLSKDELKNINDHALKKLVEGLIDEMEERPDPGPGINNERKKR